MKLKTGKWETVENNSMLLAILDNNANEYLLGTAIIQRVSKTY